MIPGFNILKMALTVIASQTVSYKAVASRTTNAAGFRNITYSALVDITGSFQPVDSQYSSQMGLDFNKTYAMWYDPNGTVRDIQRDTTGDQIVFFGSTYTALSASDWKNVDGWKGVLFVRVS